MGQGEFQNLEEAWGRLWVLGKFGNGTGQRGQEGYGSITKNHGVCAGLVCDFGEAGREPSEWDSSRTEETTERDPAGQVSEGVVGMWLQDPGKPHSPLPLLVVKSP